MAKILVVDDESEVRRALVGILKRAGHDPVEAYDGLGALDGVREHRPDVVMCDWMLPELFGGEVISTLRNDPEFAEFRNIPIIVVSDFADETSALRFKQAGADAFVAKQDNLELLKTQLLAELNTILQRTSERPKPKPGIEPL